jgi:hypothetical protein
MKPQPQSAPLATHRGRASRTLMMYALLGAGALLCSSCTPFYYVSLLRTHSPAPAGRVHTTDSRPAPSLSVGATVTAPTRQEFLTTDDQVPDQPVYDSLGAEVGRVPYDGYNVEMHHPQVQAGLSLDLALCPWVSLSADGTLSRSQGHWLGSTELGLGVQLPTKYVGVRLDNAWTVSTMAYDVVMKEESGTEPDLYDEGTRATYGYRGALTANTVRPLIGLQYYLTGSYRIGKTTMDIEDVRLTLSYVDVGGGVTRDIGDWTVLAGCRATFPGTGYRHEPDAWATFDLQVSRNIGLEPWHNRREALRERVLRNRPTRPTRKRGDSASSAVDTCTCHGGEMPFAGTCVNPWLVESAGNFHFYPSTVLYAGGAVASVVGAVMGIGQATKKAEPAEDYGTGMPLDDSTRFDVDEAYLIPFLLGWPSYAAFGTINQFTKLKQTVYLKRLGIEPPRRLLVAGWILHGLSIATGTTVHTMGRWTQEEQLSEEHPDLETASHLLPALLVHIPTVLSSYMVNTAGYICQRRMLHAAALERSVPESSEGPPRVLPYVGVARNGGVSGGLVVGL